MKVTSLSLFVTLFYLLVLSFCLCNFTLHASYLVYSENFTEQNGKGVYGPSPTIDLSNVSWDLNYSSAILSASDDYVKVVNEVLEFQDTDGIVSFESPFLDTTGYTNFFVEFELNESGDLEGTDFIEVLYTNDGGTTYSPVGSRTGNFSDDNVSDTFMVYIDEGNSIGLKIEAISNADAEYLRVDDVSIKSDTLNGATFEVNASNLSDFTGDFEIYQGEFYLADQIEFDLNLTLSKSFITLYEEDFSGKDGQGITGVGSDFTGADWNVSAPQTLSDQNDYLKVIDLNGDELFEFRDLGGSTGSWISADINISNHESLRIISSLSEAGVMESTDFMEVEYSLDQGFTYSNLKTQMGDFTSYDLNESINNGDNLIIRIKAKNSANDEKHRFDDLIVQGLGASIIGERNGGESEFSGSIELNRPVQLNVAEGGKVTLSGDVSGEDDATKNGSGIVALTNPSSTYSGNMIIKEGKLEIGQGVTLSGSVLGSGSQKSVIGGGGMVANTVIGSAEGEVDFISPGLGLASSMNSLSFLNQAISKNDNDTPLDTSDDASASIGSFTVTTVGLNDGGVFDWEIKDFAGTTPGSDWDLLSFTNLSLGSTGSKFTINILPIKSIDGTAGAPDNLGSLWAQSGKSFKFLDGPDDGAGITWGDWSPDNINDLFDFRMDEFSYYSDFYYNDWNVSYINGDFYLNFTAVPEPSTYFMTASLFLLPTVRMVRRYKERVWDNN